MYVALVTGLLNETIYIKYLLNKLEGRSKRISARGHDSVNRAQRDPYYKDQGVIFSQYDPEQGWLITDSLHE